jgi:hypothetical protein
MVVIMDKETLKQYEDYFKDDLELLDKEFKKSLNYAEKIDKEIDKFNNLVDTKGAQHYLIEHVKNAIALQSQRQSILKDKFSIKKILLDYSIKSENADSESNKSLFDELNKLIKEGVNSRTKVAEAPVLQIKNIDEEIDKIVVDLSDDED